MLRVLVLLSFLAAPAFGLWEKGYKVRYDGDPTTFGKTSLIEMPQSVSEAYESGWEKVTRPHGPAGYEKLVMWCPKNDYTYCMLYDDTGYIAGSQIAFDPERFENAIYDWTTGGFTSWTVCVDGKTTKFWTMQQYYISPVSMRIDARIRLAARDHSTLLQEKYMYVPGFKGKLFSISTDPAEIRTNSPFTEQGCLPMMGNHWYYNMTSSLTCGVDTIFPWFPMEYDNQVIALGFVWPGKYSVDEGKVFPFEEPIRLAIQMIVPNGPECLYQYGDNPGLITMHTYFINYPQQMTCGW